MRLLQGRIDERRLGFVTDVCGAVGASVSVGRVRFVPMFLGDNLLPWLLLALGGALGVGNVLAIVRPPVDGETGEVRQVPLGRSIGMAVVGFIVAIWGLASLITA